MMLQNLSNVLTGVIVYAAFLDHIEQLTNAIIYIADGAIICPSSTLDLLVCEIVAFDLANVHQTPTVGILVLFLDADGGQVDVNTIVQVPIFVLDGIWIMGMRERNCQGCIVFLLPIVNVYAAWNFSVRMPTWR